MPRRGEGDAARKEVTAKEERTAPRSNTAHPMAEGMEAKKTGTATVTGIP